MVQTRRFIRWKERKKETERKDMTEERVEPKPIDLGEYKFGFHDDVDPILSTGKGLNESVIRELSAAKMSRNGCWSSV